MSKGNILIVEDSFIVAYHNRLHLEGGFATIYGKPTSFASSLLAKQFPS